MLVSIVLLCTSDKINLFYEKLTHILRRVDFSYELIFVYQQNEVYLEKRPEVSANWQCIPRFSKRKKTISHILDACHGNIAVVLSPKMYESLFYMLDAISLLEDNQNIDMITTMEDAVFYSFFQRIKHNIIKKKYLFYVFRVDKIRNAFEKKKYIMGKAPFTLGISVYYLPYIPQFQDGYSNSMSVSLDG
ncbi:MAG: hypothetical protein KH135_01010 [Firmicutes bacterium]|nr:hypothetical protein [Bacillota bacterium]